MDYVESKIGKLLFARLLEDEDLLNTITHVAEKANVSVGLFFLIGTLKQVKMGFYLEGKYKTIEMYRPLEIVSCMGNVSVKEKKILAHAHIAVSDDKGRVFGGHVMPGCIIAATGELVLIEAVNIELLRKFEEKTKLYLWSFGQHSFKCEKEQSASA